MYNQIIVVEGKHDEQKIKSIYPDLECIVTNGSEISDEILNLIYQTSLKREVVIFLDPDFPGKQITNKILQTNGNYSIAYIDKNKAISKNRKKVGIEHAEKADIINSLQKYFTIKKDTVLVTTKDLMDRKLVNYSQSGFLREKICKELNIPRFNGKAFVKHLNLLSISIERIDEIIGQ